MKTTESNIVIIGAGLTGLTLGYYLNNEGLNISIIEARERLGGRIQTIHHKDSPPIELGATWVGKQHTEVIKLFKELGIELFKQELGNYAIYEPNSTSPAQVVQLPPNDDPSFRIKGGSDSLINSLATFQQPDSLYTNQQVKSIIKEENHLLITTNKQKFKAKVVVSTLPPHLLINTIKITPDLDHDLISVAQNTHTWMGESIKVALTFKYPFWKEDGTSGTIFSNVGPIPEMYDHSNYENSQFALKGFFNGSYHTVSKRERLELVLSQLEKYYGKVVRDYIHYDETVWKNEPYTSTKYKEQILPHQNNGHPIFKNSYLDNRLHIAGTENSPQFGGYMEGAVRSAQAIHKMITNARF